MVIDLETERRNGLDESQLAKQVMRLMGIGRICMGESERVNEMPAVYICCDCGYSDSLPRAHPRVPEPLREVRDELLAWMLPYTNKFGVEVFYGKQRHTLRISAKAIVLFDAIADFPLALALGAVRLMEKQDG